MYNYVLSKQICFPTLFLLSGFYHIFVYKIHDTSYVILCTHRIVYKNE